MRAPLARRRDRMLATLLIAPFMAQFATVSAHRATWASSARRSAR
jgi:hypothetical protein